MQTTHTSEFTIPTKYENKKAAVEKLILKYNGDKDVSETKDGSYYSVEFTDLSQGKLFEKAMDILIPDLYKY